MKNFMASRVIVILAVFWSFSIVSATTLEVKLTSTLKGKVTNTAYNVPGSNVDIYIKWTTDVDLSTIIGSTNVTTGSDGNYSVEIGPNSFKKFSGVSPTTNFKIVYTYQFSYNGTVLATETQTESLQIEDINIYNTGTEVKSAALTVEKDMNLRYVIPTPTNSNPLEPGLRFNNSFNDLDDTITINFTDHTKVPVDHWISVTPYVPNTTGPNCNSGILLGSGLNVAGNNPSGQHTFTITPTLPAKSYRINICPIYNASTMTPGTCKNSSGTNVTCQATLVVNNDNISSIESLAEFQANKAISQTKPPSFNWANLYEYWYYSPNGSPSGTPQWYYFVPSENALYEDTPNSQLGPATFLAERASDTLVVDFSRIGFNKYFSMFPDVVRMPIYNGLIDPSSPAKEALYMAIDDKLHISKPSSFAKNWSGVFQEKWALSEVQQFTDDQSAQIRNRNWIYILPSGAIYRWDGVSTGANLKGRLLHFAPPDFYTNFEVSTELFEKYTQGIFGFANSAADLNYNFSFSKSNTTEFKEYWIKSRRNNLWYYIVPNTGSIHEFEKVYPINPTSVNRLYTLGNGTYNKLTTRLLNFPY